MAVPWTVLVAAWQRSVGEPLGAGQAVQKTLICHELGVAAAAWAGTAALNIDFKTDSVHDVEPDSSSCKSGRSLFLCSWGEQQLQHTPANPKGLLPSTQTKSVYSHSLEKKFLPSCIKVRKSSCVATRTVLRSQGG